MFEGWLIDWRMTFTVVCFSSCLMCLCFVPRCCLRIGIFLRWPSLRLKSSGVKIDKVELSKRLVDSPCVVVSSSHGLSALQEKMMRAQSFGNKEQMGWMLMGGKTYPLEMQFQSCLLLNNRNVQNLTRSFQLWFLQIDEFEVSVCDGNVR